MDDHTAATEWTRMVSSAIADLHTSIWAVTEAGLTNHLSQKYRSLELVPPADLFSRCSDELSRMRHQPVFEMTPVGVHMLPAPAASKKPEFSDPFRGTPLTAQPRRLSDQTPQHARLTTLASHTASTAPKRHQTFSEEDEDEDDFDEATKAFLATSIAPSLSQLELRTLLKRFNVSPSGLKVELAQRLEQAVKIFQMFLGTNDAIREAQARSSARKMPKAVQMHSNQFSMVEFKVGPDKLPRMVVETRREVLSASGSASQTRRSSSPQRHEAPIDAPRATGALPAGAHSATARSKAPQSSSASLVSATPSWEPELLKGTWLGNDWPSVGGNQMFVQPQQGAASQQGRYERGGSKMTGIAVTAPAKSAHSPDMVFTAEGTKVPLKELGVMELRKELKKRGLSPSGLKDELIQRLKAAFELDRQGKPYTSLPPANPRGGKRVKKGTPHFFQFSITSCFSITIATSVAVLTPCIELIVARTAAGNGERKASLDALLNLSNASTYNQPSVVVLETGTSGLRVGFVGGEPSVVPFVPNIAAYHDPLTFDKMKIEYGEMEPMRYGSVVNWEAVENVWTSAVQQKLNMTSLDGCSVIVTGTGCGRLEERTQILELIFEVFGASSVLINAPEAFTLHHYGATTGFVVDSGASTTSLTPVYEGHVLPQRVRFPIAGHHITARIAAALVAASSAPTFNRAAAAQEIKEKYSYISSRDHPRAEPNRLMLADGTEMMLADTTILERYPESLFQPSLLLGQEHPSLPTCIRDVVASCDPDIRNQLLADIYVSGGTTLTSNFEKRLAHEMALFASGATVNARADRRYAAWLGASKFGALPTLPLYSLSKDDYDELGALAAVRRFF